MAAGQTGREKVVGGYASYWDSFQKLLLSSGDLEVVESLGKKDMYTTILRRMEHAKQRSLETGEPVRCVISAQEYSVLMRTCGIDGDEDAVALLKETTNV